MLWKATLRAMKVSSSERSDTRWPSSSGRRNSVALPRYTKPGHDNTAFVETGIIARHALIWAWFDGWNDFTARLLRFRSSWQVPGAAGPRLKFCQHSIEHRGRRHGDRRSSRAACDYDPQVGGVRQEPSEGRCPASGWKTPTRCHTSQRPAACRLW